MTPSLRSLGLVAFVLVLSCASSSKQSSPPAAGGTGWSAGDPLTTPVNDGTPVLLPAPAPDAGP
jgi:hypothetical protein